MSPRQGGLGSASSGSVGGPPPRHTLSGGLAVQCITVLRRVLRVIVHQVLQRKIRPWEEGFQCRDTPLTVLEALGEEPGRSAGRSEKPNEGESRRRAWDGTSQCTGVGERKVGAAARDPGARGLVLTEWRLAPVEAWTPQKDRLTFRRWNDVHALFCSRGSQPTASP